MAASDTPTSAAILAMVILSPGAFSSMVATVSKIAAFRLPVPLWLRVSFMSGNLGADPFVSQHFKQYRMRNSAIDNVRAIDACLDRIECALNLG